MSIRLVNQLLLSYDADAQRIWAILPIQNSLVVHHRVLLPAQSTAIISTKFQGSWNQNATYVATLHNPRTGFVVGGPALVNINEDRTCQVAVINTAPLDIQLERDDFIGAIEMLSVTPVKPMDALPVASILQPSQTPAFSRQQLQATIMAHTDPAFTEDLFNLLSRYKPVLTRGSTGSRLQDPRRVHLAEPLYHKQGKIPLAHRPLIEENLDSWIRLGLVRKADSMFNTPLFCLQHPNGYRIVQDFRALNRKDHPEPLKFKKIHETLLDLETSKPRIFSTLDLRPRVANEPLRGAGGPYRLHHSRTGAIPVEPNPTGHPRCSGRFSSASRITSRTSSWPIGTHRPNHCLPSPLGRAQENLGSSFPNHAKEQLATQHAEIFLGHQLLQSLRFPHHQRTRPHGSQPARNGRAIAGSN